MNTVFDVADWFLSKESMTHKKLQKLCYYAQAWHCALFRGTPIFDNVIEAWIHGPVSPDLYRKYSDFKWENIPQTAGSSDSVFSADALELLQAVYNTYHELTGDQLERLTHTEEPWIQARGDSKPWEPCTNPISLESMRAYYACKYEQAQND